MTYFIFRVTCHVVEPLKFKQGNINCGSYECVVCLPQISVNIEGFERYNITSKVKLKVKFTLEQATMAHRGSRGIAVLCLLPRR